MVTQTLIKKSPILRGRREKMAGVLGQIRTWRLTTGTKLQGWNEVKTIRQWRARK